jgi:hypothetical protein
MNLTASIESADHLFRQILEDFFISVYDEKNLPSHGIDHHRRVWRYARELLSVRFARNNSLPSCNPSKLIIACYLHDIGMSAEPGPRHGKHSRELCNQFLHENRLAADDYTDVLDAIEFHDRKDYSSEPGKDDLLTVLSIADDLDAFGFTGIYRYSEILLSREVKPPDLGHLILGNAKRRFDNFLTIIGTGNNYVARHRERYEILRNFFKGYNQQSCTYNFNTDEVEGYCGLIRLFMVLAKEKMPFGNFFVMTRIYEDDIIIGPVLAGLKTELFSGREQA